MAKFMSLKDALSEHLKDGDTVAFEGIIGVQKEAALAAKRRS